VSCPAYRFVLAVCSLMSVLLGCGDSSAPSTGIAGAPDAETFSETVTETAVVPEDQASGPSLEIGDPAPLLQIADWVKGELVTDYQADQVYVVEFWATWCPPCRAGMPHLSALQAAYGEEVTFIGVTRESADVVQAFLKKPADESIANEAGKTWDDLMHYTVAVDADAATSTAFMKAANESGIPTAFVVGFDGKIEWIGHPMEIDEPLQKIAARTWDRASFLASRQAKRQRQGRLDALSRNISAAVENQDWDQALGSLNELVGETPSNPKIMRFKLRILNQAGRGEEAIQTFDEIVAELGDNARGLNRLAGSVASDEASEKTLLSGARTIAERAAELTGYADGDILDTLARVHFALDDLEQAIVWQTRAVEAELGNEKLQRTLDGYRAHLKTDAAESDAVEGKEAQTEPRPLGSDQAGFLTATR